MASTIFRVQSHKFSQDNIHTTLVCSKCDEVFSKEFPLALEGQTIEFKCPVCGVPGEADIPYKSAEEREEFEEDFEETEEEEEGGEDFEEEY
jgi:phage FluMu protein Com